MNSLSWSEENDTDTTILNKNKSNSNNNSNISNVNLLEKIKDVILDEDLVSDYDDDDDDDPPHKYQSDDDDEDDYIDQDIEDQDCIQGDHSSVEKDDEYILSDDQLDDDEDQLEEEEEEDFSPPQSQDEEEEQEEQEQEPTTKQECTQEKSDKEEPAYLEHEWVFYYDDSVPKGQTCDDYQSHIKNLGSFNSIQGFWGYWNNIVDPCLFPDGGNLRLFKKGIAPAWEDPANSSGGKWTFSCYKDQSQQIALKTILSLIGEQLDHSIDICGFVLSVRSTRHIISVWNKSGDNQEIIDQTSEQLSNFIYGKPFKYYQHKQQQLSNVPNSPPITPIKREYSSPRLPPSPKSPYMSNNNNNNNSNDNRKETFKHKKSQSTSSIFNSPNHQYSPVPIKSSSIDFNTTNNNNSQRTISFTNNNNSSDLLPLPPKSPKPTYHQKRDSRDNNSRDNNHNSTHKPLAKSNSGSCISNTKPPMSPATSVENISSLLKTEEKALLESKVRDIIMKKDVVVEKDAKHIVVEKQNTVIVASASITVKQPPVDDNERCMTQKEEVVLPVELNEIKKQQQQVETCEAVKQQHQEKELITLTENVAFVGYNEERLVVEPDGDKNCNTNNSSGSESSSSSIPFTNDDSVVENNSEISDYQTDESSVSIRQKSKKKKNNNSKKSSTQSTSSKTNHKKINHKNNSNSSKNHHQQTHNSRVGNGRLGMSSNVMGHNQSKSSYFYFCRDHLVVFLMLFSIILLTIILQNF
ncbi:hypothetical protein CYY_001205 [Polysphondylium violaceum]|uniref:Uncharacterized protein n=1 Tax=Polysphondylium violaceum TaxID=133409 RepID=A0A8J4UWF9_9MYCE|nr:hypothetical protein CYY_001205 [Polysphondylium violaceum]